MLALALIYAVLARLGLALDAVSGFAALVWPPSGLSLAALVLGGMRLWPGVMLGAFVANATAGAPPVIAGCIAVGNTLEAVVAVMMLSRVGFRPALDRVRDVAALVLFGAVTSTTVSASVGVASLWAGGVIPRSAVEVTWGSWWLGDALGDLVVAPMLLVWAAWWRDRARPTKWPTGARLAEAAALALTAGALAALVFALPDGPGRPFRQPFILFPMVVWAAIRFRLRGVTAAVVFLSAAAIAGTTLGLGPFARDRLVEGLAALQVFTAVLTVGGLVLGALVAERQRAERALEEAVRVRDEFVSVASHELRTPLSVLSLDIGRLVRLEESGRSDLPHRRGERLRRALRQVERLDGLTENLLGASRIAHGRLHVEVDRWDLAVLAREVVDAFADDLSGEGRISLEAAGPVVGLWDRGLVEQALTNLVSNAVKYGQDKPIQVVVTTASQGGSAASLASVAVTDHGMGIDGADQQRIFERFERAVSPRNIAGLGLGLYITRQIAEAHGGNVRVTSAAGTGSTFVLQLPLAPGAVQT